MRKAIVLAALALLVTACGSAPTTTAEGLTVLRVGVSAAAGTSTPIYLAIARNVFRKLGLDVQLVPSTEGTVVVPQLMNGQLQFSMASFGPFVSAVQQNLPIRMVAAINRSHADNSQYSAIIVPADSKATDLSQVKVFASQEAQRDPLDQLAFAKMNGDYAGARIVAVPLGSVGDTVASHSADAGRLFQPFLRQALDKGGVKVLRYLNPPYTLANIPTTVLEANTGYLNQNPDIARRFTEGVHEALTYARDHLTEVAAYAPKTGLTTKPIDMAAMPDYEPTGIDRAKIDELLGLYESEGYLNRKLASADVTWAPPAGS
ncbi:ABC transporter substrate-binding protein [Kutzneria sp. NPDC052558]|uniref:ABC transporter substrate-binding protein n=1 Tax=Kutzneria sp. NPDC052558 TaxID=3364121 RepID=UPI0037CB6824